jgi:isopentenyldiphosphate isomerase
LPEPHDEPVNVYDAEGRPIGVRSREEAKRSGLAVGAVNVLLADARGRVLLQRRPADKENGGRWDKTVGGHVDAGEGFDGAAVREAGEELFGDPRSQRVRLVAREDFEAALAGAALEREVVFRRQALQLGLRDVRLTPDGSTRNAVYHVASYLGRTDIPLEAFRPQSDEIADLRWATATEVDALLLRCQLSPNMAYLWLTHALELLSLPGVRAGRS